MLRVVLLKSGKFKDCVFRAGFVHELPENLAQALLDANWAYVEGEEPPFDAATIAAWAAPHEAQVVAEQHAELLRDARRKADTKKTREMEVALEAIERSAALRASRAAKKGK